MAAKAIMMIEVRAIESIRDDRTAFIRKPPEMRERFDEQSSIEGKFGCVASYCPVSMRQSHPTIPLSR